MVVSRSVGAGNQLWSSVRAADIHQLLNHFSSPGLWILRIK